MKYNTVEWAREKPYCLRVVRRVHKLTLSASHTLIEVKRNWKDEERAIKASNVFHQLNWGSKCIWREQYTWIRKTTHRRRRKKSHSRFVWNEICFSLKRKENSVVLFYFLCVCVAVCCNRLFHLFFQCLIHSFLSRRCWWKKAKQKVCFIY